MNDLEEIKTTTWPGLMFSTLDISKNTPLSDDHNTVKIESFHYAFGNIGSTIRKVDKNGEEIWNKRYLSGYSRDYQNTIVSCDEDRFGNIWLTGYTGSTDRYRPKSAYWQKLSPDGTFLDGGNFGKAPRMPEENYSGRTSWFVPNSIHINKSGEAFVSGSYDIWWLNNNSSNGGYHKVTYPQLSKINSLGVNEWNKTLSSKHPGSSYFYRGYEANASVEHNEITYVAIGSDIVAVDKMGNYFYSIGLRYAGNNSATKYSYDEIVNISNLSISEDNFLEVQAEGRKVIKQLPNGNKIYEQAPITVSIAFDFNEDGLADTNSNYFFQETGFRRFAVSKLRAINGETEITDQLSNSTLLKTIKTKEGDILALAKNNHDNSSYLTILGALNGDLKEIKSIESERISSFEDIFQVDLQEAPTNLSLSASFFDENIANGSVVATLKATDPDSRDTHSYSLIDNIGNTDNSAFTVDGDKLKINASPDYETQDSYLVRIKTEDLGGLTFEKAFTFTVKNIKEMLSSSTNKTLPTSIEDLVLTGTGNLRGYGNSSNNRLTGNSGNNLLDGKAGSDVMIGNAGNDTYIVDNARDRVIEKADGGKDTIRSSVSEALSANVENLVLTGTGNLNGYGNSSNNHLTGNAGKNLLDGKAGSDVMIGNAGNDTYIVDNARDRVIEKADGGKDTIRSSVSEALSANVENLVLTGTGNLNGYGNSSNNHLTGNAGKNLLDGKAGSDVMIGNAGNDTYIVDNARDRVIEKADGGKDTIRSSVSEALSANVENLVLTGTGNLNGYGNSSNNHLTGNAGKNLLDGKAGSDVMIGNAGNDTYIVDNARDRVIEKADGGKDTIRSSVSEALSANVENLVLTGTGNLNGYGNSSNNHLTGNAGKNLLDGKAGSDVMIGNAGNDTYIVDNARDRVIEKADGGKDTIRSSVSKSLSENVENLVLTGTRNLNGYGNSSNNWLTGNAGNNVLEGKAGRDILTGKEGVDKFVYRSVGDSGITKSTRDIITDFDSTESDRIDLSRIDAYAGKIGNQKFVYIGSKSFSGTQGEVRFASGILSMNTGTDTRADMQIKLNGVSEFSSDFLIL